MSAHQEFQSVEHIIPCYVKKHDGDGDMLYLENEYTGEALVLCGTVEEIQNLLTNAYQMVVKAKRSKEPPMKPIQSLIQKAHNKGLLRYAPKELLWDPTRREFDFDLKRTVMSGVEFGYDILTDTILWAHQTVDGTELETEEFLDELKRVVGYKDQPCQHYAATRAIVDEEPEVTAHNDDTIPCALCGEPVFDDDTNAHVSTRRFMCEEGEPERTWVVTQVTAVKAADKYQAIDRVNEMHGSSELLSQDAEPHLEKFRIGAVHEVWAEDEKHAVEQFYDIVNNDNGGEIVNFIEEVPS